MSVQSYEFRSTPFFRAVASACLLVFAAWLVLPSCACQLSSLLGGDVATQVPSGEEPLAGELPSGFEDCHCHDELPKTFVGGEALFLSDEIGARDCLSDSAASDLELRALVVATQSSRGPPSAHSFLGLAKGRAYLAFCVFLL